MTVVIEKLPVAREVGAFAALSDPQFAKWSVVAVERISLWAFERHMPRVSIRAAHGLLEILIIPLVPADRPRQPRNPGRS